jgi:hypothetical protein
MACGATWYVGYVPECPIDSGIQDTKLRMKKFE